MPGRSPAGRRSGRASVPLAQDLQGLSRLLELGVRLECRPVLPAGLFLVSEPLVDHPEAVDVKEVSGERTTVYELRVDPNDFGKVIGKQGKTARALRTILTASCTKLGKRCVLEILE